MRKTPKVKGSQLSVGQRVAWPVRTKNDSGESVIDKFLASRVKKVDSQNVYFENGEKKKVKESFTVLRNDTEQLFYNADRKDLIRDLKKTETADDDDEETEFSIDELEYAEEKAEPADDDDEETEFSIDELEYAEEKAEPADDDDEETELPGVEEATPPLLNETEYLDKYTKQIKGTLETFDKLSKKLQNDEEQVNSTIYSVAKILSTAQEEAKLEAKFFAKLKSEVAEELKAISTRNLNKAIRVASDKRIQQYQNRLPNTYSVLYSLTSLKKEEFEKLLEDEDVTPDITRNKLIDKVNEIKGKKHSIKKTFTIIRKDTNAATDNDIEILKKFLESTEWKLKEAQPTKTVKTIQTPKSQKKVTE